MLILFDQLKVCNGKISNNVYFCNLSINTAVYLEQSINPTSISISASTGVNINSWLLLNYIAAKPIIFAKNL